MKSVRETNHQRGFTLIELIAVIVIMSILTVIAVKKLGPLSENIRVEETKQEMDALAFAIVGNPELQNNGVRSDFGYVGDVGALPPNLDALMSNPGSYTTWRGPYAANRFAQTTDDYKKDAWQVDYTYAGGVTITSTGSGSAIARKLAGSTGEVLINRVSGNVYDLDGTPPGAIWKDSVRLLLTIPNGSGGLTTKAATPNAGGYFGFDSIPIGNHDLAIVYLPSHDTIRRYASVLPGSSLYGDYYLPANVWIFTPGGTEDYLTKVDGSDSLVTDCHGFYFWIENKTGHDIPVSTVTLSWSGETSYFRYVIWDGVTVFDSSNPKAGSGESVTFTVPQTIVNGDKLRIDFDFFKENPTGGQDVDMNNLTFTVTFSDGSTMTVTTGNCP